jgi:hypothetical protein
MEDIGELLKYKGVAIQIFRRNNSLSIDYGYRTNIGISGTGQRSPMKALADAMRAINEIKVDKLSASLGG